MKRIFTTHSMPKIEPGLCTSESAGSRWIIAHAGSEYGFINNALLIFKSQSKSSDNHDDMNSTNFLKWMNEELVTNLPERSLVVMDIAPDHCTQINKAPIMSNLKVDICKSGCKKKEYIEDPWTKAILFIIKENKGKLTYVVLTNELLKSHNHEVLRLHRPYHCDLNQIKKIWSPVKRRVAEKNDN
ncbi:hypothetical protein HF086_003272 [Spodoptera exigua]|uniref:Uncharacterized protein n=1 Tax=Spodoptera exigua TaxID=7107 RepID=A0A922SFZ5_SPOEX|nr:hypothetical protein HF086_003272 [Spodoptera exigua]